LNGYEIKFDPENNRPPEQFTVGTTESRGIRPARAGGQAPASPSANPAGSAVRTNPAPPVPQPAASAKARSCPSDPLLTAAQQASDSQDLSFKRAILSGYQKKVAEPTGSAPLAVGVAFDTFQIGQPRLNQQTLDRTDGTYIRGAAVGEKIFPVRTAFTECELYRREILRTAVDGRYECYKDTFGGWACVNASGWRTLKTEREVFAQ